MTISRCFALVIRLFVFLAPAVAANAQDGLPTGPTLVFDADTKEFKAGPQDMTASFSFHATNVWTNTIVVQQVHASCHCTVPHMPAEPWILLPGASGEITAQVDLSDKMEGTMTKTLTFFTSVGERVLTLNVIVPPLPRPVDRPQTEAERRAAMLKATADATAIFKGDCASCHVEKGRGLLGKDLFVADCGICHDSPHRASFVPDLRALKQATNAEYWKTVLLKGKAHSLMPAFADTAAGPLTLMQMTSLADYLEMTFPNRPLVK